MNEYKLQISKENSYIITKGNQNYILDLQLLEGCVSIKIKTNLPVSIYEGLYSFEEISKLPYLKNFNSLNVIVDKIKLRISKNKFKISIDSDKKLFTLTLIYEIDDEEHYLDLILHQHKEIDKDLVINEISEELNSVINKVYELESKITDMLDSSSVLENKVKNLEENMEKVLFKLNLFEDDDKISVNSKSNNIINGSNANSNEKQSNENFPDSKINEYFASKSKDIDKKIGKAYSNINKLEQKVAQIPFSYLAQIKMLIKNSEEEALLKTWIDSKRKLKFTIVYDSILDGPSSLIFHTKCDNIGPTLSIVESAEGKRFGGYTQLSWDISGKYKPDDLTAFLFSLTDKRRFMCKSQKSVINCDKNYLIWFGAGCDLALSNNFTSYKHGFNFGVSYDSSGIKNPKSYFLGSAESYIKKLEVYKVDYDQ